MSGAPNEQVVLWPFTQTVEKRLMDPCGRWIQAVPGRTDQPPRRASSS